MTIGVDRVPPRRRSTRTRWISPSCTLDGNVTRPREAQASICFDDLLAADDDRHGSLRADGRSTIAIGISSGPRYNRTTARGPRNPRCPQALQSEDDEQRILRAVGEISLNHRDLRWFARFGPREKHPVPAARDLREYRRAGSLARCDRAGSRRARPSRRRARTLISPRRRSHFAATNSRLPRRHPLSHVDMPERSFRVDLDGRPKLAPASANAQPHPRAIARRGEPCGTTTLASASRAGPLTGHPSISHRRAPA